MLVVIYGGLALLFTSEEIDFWLFPEPPILRDLADMIIDQDLRIEHFDPFVVRFKAKKCSGLYLFEKSPPLSGREDGQEVLSIRTKGEGWEIVLKYWDGNLAEYQVNNRAQVGLERTDYFLAQGILASVHRSMRV